MVPVRSFFLMVAIITAGISSPLSNVAWAKKREQSKWVVVEDVDEITDKKSKRAMLVTGDITSQISPKVQIAMLGVNCINNGLMVAFIAGQASLIEPNSEIEYRFGSTPGKSVSIDLINENSTGAVIFDDKAKSFVNEAITNSSVVVRVMTYRGSILARFQASNAKHALEEALAECWQSGSSQ